MAWREGGGISFPDDIGEEKQGQAGYNLLPIYEYGTGRGIGP